MSFLETGWNLFRTRSQWKYKWSSINMEGPDGKENISFGESHF